MMGFNCCNDKSSASPVILVARLKLHFTHDIPNDAYRKARAKTRIAAFDEVLRTAAFFFPATSVMITLFLAWMKANACLQPAERAHESWY